MRKEIEALLSDWENDYWDMRNESPKEALQLGECISGLLRLLLTESDAQLEPTKQPFNEL